MVDLRLLGLVMRQERVSQVARRLLTWTWGGLVFQAISGSLLLTSEAVKLYHIAFFWIKMALLLVAALNAWIFHWGVYRNVFEWDAAPVTPIRARLAGAFSLTLWIGVIAAGRAIGYV